MGLGSKRNRESLMVHTSIIFFKVLPDMIWHLVRIKVNFQMHESTFRHVHATLILEFFKARLKYHKRNGLQPLSLLITSFRVPFIQ